MAGGRLPSSSGRVYWWSYDVLFRLTVLVVERPCLGCPTNRESGVNPERPRRCNREQEKLHSSMAIVACRPAWLGSDEKAGASDSPVSRPTSTAPGTLARDESPACRLMLAQKLREPIVRRLKSRVLSAS